MTPQAIARQYAGALVDVTQAAHKLDDVRRDMAAFHELTQGSAELRQVFDSVVVPAQKKRELVEALLPMAGVRTDEVRRLLGLLADRDRLRFLDAIVTEVEARAAGAERAVPAEVTTAVPLVDQSRRALADALARAVGRPVTLNERIDPAIIGGVVARVGSVVFDGSVQRQLERLREAMTSE